MALSNYLVLKRILKISFLSFGGCGSDAKSFPSLLTTYVMYAFSSFAVLPKFSIFTINPYLMCWSGGYQVQI